MSLDLELLERIAPIPTAPFKEGNVHQELARSYDELFSGNRKVSSWTDKFGNIFWRYKGCWDEKDPKLALVVHTDHPGFEVIPLADGTLDLQMMGGLEQSSVVGAKVRLHTDTKQNVGFGTIDHAVKAAENSFKSESHRYNLKPDTPSKLNDPYTFATLDLKSFEIGSDNIIRSPVLDDFSAIAMSIAALKEIVDQEIPLDVYVVFHRAEEVAFMGAWGVASNGGLPRNTYVLSVENSSYVKNGKVLAPIGNGIVVRTGDIYADYHDKAIQILTEAKESIGSHKSQVRKMTGGVCEALAYAAMGYPVAGVAVPLGQYHNNRLLEGGKGFGREFIHEDDLHAGTALLVATAAELEEFAPEYKRYRKVKMTKNLRYVDTRLREIFKAYQEEKYFDRIQPMLARGN